MKKISQVFVPLFVGGIVAFSLSACLSQLKTREDLKGETQASQPPAASSPSVVVESPALSNEQSATASSVPAYKQEERNEQIRALYGRVEESEHQVQELRQSMIELAESRQKEKEESAQKLQAYEEAIKEMETQIQALKEEKAKAEVAPTSGKKGASAKSSDDFQKGEGLYSQKKWKEAIVAYQKYRENQPKGKFYADATYKMGQAFLALGMKDESKSFFEEVRVKYPKSPLAKKAEKQLKSL